MKLILPLVLITVVAVFHAVAEICITNPPTQLIAGVSNISIVYDNPFARPCWAVVRFANDEFQPITYSFDPPSPCSHMQQNSFLIPHNSPSGDAIILWNCLEAGTLCAAVSILGGLEDTSINNDFRVRTGYVSCTSTMDKQSTQAAGHAWVTSTPGLTTLVTSVTAGRDRTTVTPQVSHTALTASDGASATITSGQILVTSSQSSAAVGNDQRETVSSESVASGTLATEDRDRIFSSAFTRQSATANQTGSKEFTTSGANFQLPTTIPQAASSKEQSPLTPTDTSSSFRRQTVSRIATSSESTQDRDTPSVALTDKTRSDQAASDTRTIPTAPSQQNGQQTSVAASNKASAPSVALEVGTSSLTAGTGESIAPATQVTDIVTFPSPRALSSSSVETSPTIPSETPKATIGQPSSVSSTQSNITISATGGIALPLPTDFSAGTLPPSCDMDPTQIQLLPPESFLSLADYWKHRAEYFCHLYLQENLARLQEMN
ncbi:hypothetical protein QBC43DRAFT_355453 [Cladorrhinum sp. PSN259]|nr:hypothetical protein QBC43DRAFT_355453 [Cladorrhinum sp. PSN259]